MTTTERKKAKCPVCCPDQPYATFKRSGEFDDNGNWTQMWQCTNCGGTHPLQKAPLKSVKVLMARIRRIRDDMLAHHGSGFRPSEVKRLKVSRDHWDAGMLFVTIEVGYEGDEGTGLSIVARDYRHIMLDRYGKVELMNAKHKARSRGIYNAATAATK